MGSSNNFDVIKVCIVVILSVLVAGVLSGCSPQPEQPEDAFRRWMDYQAGQKYGQAWEMMTPELQKRRGIRGFHVGIINAGWRGDFAKFTEEKALYDFGDESGDSEDLIKRVSEWETVRGEGKAVMTAVVPYRGFDWHLEVVLQDREGRWQIAKFSAIGHLPPGSTMKWIE